MKITDFACYEVSIPTRRRHTWASSTADVGQGWFILKVFTDEGIVGYGEATAMGEWGGDFSRYYGETASTCAVVIRENIFPAIVGSDPFDIDLIHHKMDAAKNSACAQLGRRDGHGCGGRGSEEGGRRGDQKY